MRAGGIEIGLQGADIEKSLADDTVATQKTVLVDILSGTDLEQQNVNPDPNALKSIAEAGNGVGTDISYADILGERIPDRTHSQESVQQIGLFADPRNPMTKIAHWAFLAVFVVLITTEWIVRKVGGLV